MDGSNYLQYLRLLEKALTLFPGFKATNRGVTYQLLQQLFGCCSAERLAHFRKQISLLLTKKMQSWVVAGGNP